MISLLAKDLSKLYFGDQVHFFDLPYCIYKAFNIILKQAQNRNIQLIGEVELESHMILINKIKGNSGRFVQMLVNLMAHALSSIEDDGTIRVQVGLK